MIIGKKIQHYPEVTSTNDMALRLATQGIEEGTVITADFQTNGRGRQGRRWLSPPGQGLLLSVILRPKIFLEQSMLITLMSSVAVAQAIERISLARTQIKWPNDIILNKKKVGGILTEANSEADRIKFAVVGIGLNVNSDIEDLPKGAISVKEIIARHIPVADVQTEVLNQLDHYYQLFRQGHLEQIIEEYRHKSVLLGRQVRATSNGQTIEGQAVDISANGSLVVRLDTGFLISLHWPEVEMVR